LALIASPLQFGLHLRRFKGLSHRNTLGSRLALPLLSNRIERRFKNKVPFTSKEAAMLPIKTILYPTDFSPPSDYAFQVACSLARDYGAKLVVLHVDMPPVTIGEVISYQEPQAYKEKLWDEFRRLQASEPGIRDLRLETKLAEGNPAKEILATANEIKPELIVMGTHGRTGLGRLLMGSVAEEVVRKSPFPVLTVKTPIPAPRVAKEFSPKSAVKLQEPVNV
jgi:nucleotide-binding universal stress UspA family protein